MIMFLQLPNRIWGPKYATAFKNMFSITEVMSSTLSDFEVLALQNTFPKLDLVFDPLAKLNSPQTECNSL